MPGIIELNKSKQVFVKSVVDCEQQIITSTVFVQQMNVYALERYRTAKPTPTKKGRKLILSAFECYMLIVQIILSVFIFSKLRPIGKEKKQLCFACKRQRIKCNNKVLEGGKKGHLVKIRIIKNSG